MKTLINLIMAIVSVFAPLKAVLITTLVLVAADLITGVLAARQRKEPITSAGFRRTITKIFVYESALLLGFLAETYLIGALLPVCKIISAFIGVTEIKSIIENLNSISGGSMLAALVSKLNSQNIETPK